MSLNLKMNLDKKSLIQIVVLAVLIAVGAGVYFMQQGGDGLDFITGFFESKPTATRAPRARAAAPGAPRGGGPGAGAPPPAPRGALFTDKRQHREWHPHAASRCHSR